MSHSNSIRRRRVGIRGKRQRIVAWRDNRPLEENDSEQVSQINVVVVESLFDLIEEERNRRDITARDLIEEILVSAGQITIEELIAAIIIESDNEFSDDESIELRYLASRIDANNWRELRMIVNLLETVSTSALVRLLVRKHYGLLTLEEDIEE